MRVLLNATAGEIDGLGGDVSKQRDWIRLGQLDAEGLGFVPLEESPLRRLSMIGRMAAEKLTRSWQPERVRRRLFLLSRYLYVPAASRASAEVVFSHLHYPVQPGRPPLPVVWNSQGLSPPAYYEHVNRGQWDVDDVAWLYRTLGSRAARLTVVTASGARNLVSRCPELEPKVRVVPAPVFNGDPPPGKPSERDGIVRLLFVGIDARRKGLPEVVEAFRLLRAASPNVRLDVVTRPPAWLARRIAALPDATLHPSSRTVDVRALMRDADVFVLPTHADTYALAAVEAMANRCAVIVSDLDPLPEIAPHGSVGFNVPAGSVEALLACLTSLVGSERLLRRMQGRARETYLDRHHPSAVLPRLRRVLEEVVELAAA